MLSRSARITLLLVVDVCFFFVELIVGYAVGSLALVADSFHMLNDVMSLVVALYAIKLTARNPTNPRYSYGWHRAEILAALINGVFLLALCFSISLEALQRFFSTPEISNPELVVIVGSLGLASNIAGLFLFHEHGHSRGHSSPASAVPSIAPSKTPSIISPTTNHGLHASGDATPTQKAPTSPKSIRSPTRRSRSHSRLDSQSSLYGHPAATRASLVQAAQDIAHARSPSPQNSNHSTSFHGSYEQRNSLDHVMETSNLDNDTQFTPMTTQLFIREDGGEASPLLADHRQSSVAADREHDHNAHSHSHAGSMNMRALVLHVLGDALGNVGVIATGLIIWLTTWSYKYYFDPVISLVITIIIFSSALPLVRSASFILLQAVPSNVSVEAVRDSILEVEGVLSLHELHIWQLSESKIVASVHVMASRSHDFMPIAATIRKALHHHGIHSSTIQPEYHHSRNGPPEEGLNTTTDTPCLILCPADAECDPQENACCPPPSSDF